MCILGYSPAVQEGNSCPALCNIDRENASLFKELRKEYVNINDPVLLPGFAEKFVALAPQNILYIERAIGENPHVREKIFLTKENIHDFKHDYSDVFFAVMLNWQHELLHKNCFALNTRVAFDRSRGN